MFKKVLFFPITLLSIILMVVGALSLGYSVVTLFFNNNFVETKSEVVKREDSNGTFKEVIEFEVDGQTYQAKFPFLRLKEGTKITVGYNPESPTWFHLGSRKTHFAFLLWGAFFMLLGLVMMFSMRGLKGV